MATASPSPTSGPAPPAAPAAPAASPSRPRVGDLQDRGAVRRDSVEADRWTASGTVKVTGDVRVGTAQLAGMVSVGGKISASAFRCEGRLEVGGPVDVTGKLESSGDLRAAATVHATEADLRGELQLAGAVSVDRMLTVRGNLSAPSLTVGALTLEGAAQVPGDIVAAEVSARFTHDSALGTVKARTVSLRAKIPNLVERMMWRRTTVSARRVEADTVELEAVSVQFVRSPQITLGREAHVTQYEGTIVRRHPTSRVGFESRSPPPYGLRR